MLSVLYNLREDSLQPLVSFNFKVNIGLDELPSYSDAALNSSLVPRVYQ